jgi:hypothetical protein
MNQYHKLTVLIIGCTISSYLQSNPYNSSLYFRRQLANQDVTVTGQQLSRLFVTTPDQIAGEVERTILGESVSPKSRGIILDTVSTTGSESFSPKERDEIMKGLKTRKLRRALTSLMLDEKSTALLLTNILSPMSKAEKWKALEILLNTTSAVRREALVNRLASE